MDEPTNEERIKFMQAILPDSEFKSRFQAAIQTLMPDLGEGGLMPKLVLTHFLAKESYEADEAVFGTDVCFLALDDFNENRYKHIESIGMKAAIDKRNALMACIASECWYSQQRMPKDKKPKFTRAGDDPNRREGIMVAARSIDGRGAYSMSIVDRDSDGKFCRFGDLDIIYSFDGGKGQIETQLLDQFWRGYYSELKSQLAQ